MIEKMRKYSFVLYHLDYESFIQNLQQLGLLHIIRSNNSKTDSQIQNLELIKDYSECSTYLQKLNSASPIQAQVLPPKALFNKIIHAREEKDKLNHQRDILKKQIRDLNPWGHFDYTLVQKLKDAGLSIDFHTCLKNHFKSEWQLQNPLEIVAEKNGILYFVVISDSGSPALEADTFSFHQHTLQEFENQLQEVEQRIADIDEYLNNIAPTAIDTFNSEIKLLSKSYDYEDALEQGQKEADDHLRLISGWIPISLEAGLKEFIAKNNIISFSENARLEDNPPIKLRNNWFSRLFEPISKMYMLPYYNEFDLTPFLAPFFMIFFGFCNADIAYGIVIILLALFLKLKSKNAAMKSMMTLLMFFGTASIIMGWIMGSALGYDLKQIGGLGEKIIIQNNDQIFRFALLLGVIQILFGVFISTVKSISQNGFKYGLAPFGTFLLIAAFSTLGAQQLGTDISSVQPYLKYPLYVGLALILLFNNPPKNIIVNILGGIWALYNIVTGFFGDILSYIRLFALGVSSAILGFVVNSIGAQMSGIPYIGPVIFVIFMLFGHTLNLALGGLSGFVHPLRLTFVEFYKNAGFSGPGIAYNPFGKKE